MAEASTVVRLGTDLRAIMDPRSCGRSACTEASTFWVSLADIRVVLQLYNYATRRLSDVDIYALHIAYVICKISCIPICLFSTYIYSIYISPA